MSARERAVALARRLPPAQRIETRRWERSQRRCIDSSIDDPQMLERLARGERLPAGYGAGFSERVVEIPWVLAQKPAGRMLDAGSALNHAHVLDRLLPRVDELHVLTLAPEDVAFPERGVSYLYADLRDTPLRDGVYDTIVSVSTLEHVGMDNSGYGADGRRAGDPNEDLRRAVAELRRLLAPGGRLLATVPYGQREDHGWLRQFDAGDVAELVEAAGGGNSAITVYAQGTEGWQPSSLEAASTARYLMHKASAVACISVEA